MSPTTFHQGMVPILGSEKTCTALTDDLKSIGLGNSERPNRRLVALNGGFLRESAQNPLIQVKDL